MNSNGLNINSGVTFTVHDGQYCGAVSASRTTIGYITCGTTNAITGYTEYIHICRKCSRYVTELNYLAPVLTLFQALHRC